MPLKLGRYLSLSKLEVALVSGRRSGGKHKKAGTREEPELPKPDRNPQAGKTMSELAASRGVSEATPLAD